MSVKMIGSFVVALIILPFVSAGRTVQRDGIYYLQQDDFDTVLERQTFAVYFHSPWTEGSSEVLFEFQQAATSLLAEEAQISFGVVDLSQDDYTGYRFGVFKGPHMRVFHDGKPYHYNGNNTRVDMIEQLRLHASLEWSPPEAKTEVIVLESVADFEAHIKKEKITLVDFYAPWCNHCQQLEPVLVSVAEELAKLTPPITVAKINVDQNNELFTRYKMKGYPYVFLFKNGKHILYEDAKSVPGIVEFVKARASAASSDIPAIVGAAYSFSDSKKSTAVIGFFPSRSAVEFQVFTDLAERMRDEKGIAFGHVIGSKALEVAREEFGVDNEDYGIILVRDRRLPVRRGEKRYSIFEEDPIEKDSAEEFIKANRLSLIGYATVETYRQLYGKLSNVVLLFMDVDWDPDTRDAMNYRLNQMAKVAELFPSIHFVALDHSDMHELRTHVGLGENDNDMTAAVYVNSTYRYPLDGECNVESLTAHLNAFEAGNQLTAYTKSQKVPASNSGPVKALVRSTYSEVLADTSRDVAVVFVAPWSKESQKFLPVFKRAHATLSEESVAFYKYDGVANDLPEGLEIKKFPTLILFKAEEDRSKTGIKYNGPRNSKSITEFLRENAATLSQPEEQEEESNDEEEGENHDEL